MRGAFYAPDLASQDPLFIWWADPTGRQHAFRGDHPLRSICKAMRWTVKASRDPDAPFCPECRRLVWSLTDAARDHVVDAEARAMHRDDPAA